MKPYSYDLRARVVEAYLNQEGTQRELAERFRVSPSFVQSMIRRYRQTGSLKPKPHAGGYPTTIDERGLVTVLQLANERPTATLNELCEEFSRIEGHKPSRATMWRAVKRAEKIFEPASDASVESEAARSLKEKGAQAGEDESSLSKEQPLASSSKGPSISEDTSSFKEGSSFSKESSSKESSFEKREGEVHSLRASR